MQVKKLWALVATLLESLQESGSEILSKMYILVAAGLKSRHRAILNDAVLMWNRIFGCAESLDYPDDLRNPLLKLKLVTDIDLPGFPDQTSEEVSAFNVKAWSKYLQREGELFAFPLHRFSKCWWTRARQADS